MANELEIKAHDRDDIFDFFLLPTFLFAQNDR